MTKIYTRGWPIEERLKFYSEPHASGCVLWTGPKISTGYGNIKIDSKNYKAHRVSWQERRGPIPYGKHVLHKCDNPSCINPDHLFIGTHDENMSDKVAKNRQAKGVQHSHAVKKSIPYGDRRSQSKLTYEKVFEMRWREALGEKISDIAREYNVGRTTAFNAINGVNWQFEIHD